jgi:hypothetical protein
MIDFTLQIKSIDYNAVVEKLLPVISEKLSENESSGPLQLILGKFKGLSGSAIKAALAVLPSEVIDELVVSFIGYYKEDIIKAINQIAADNQLKIEVGDLNAKIPGSNPI